MAEAFNVSVCPHFLMELHVSLVCAVPNAPMLEYIPQLDAITSSRLDIRDGRAVPRGAGTGNRMGLAGDRCAGRGHSSYQ